MNYVKLDVKEAIILKDRLNESWNIMHHYWYPLYDCIRDDLIAFDSEYIECDEKMLFLREILIRRNVKSVYEFREDGTSFKVDDFYDYRFWMQDDYFWNNECFWFDKTMDWIIYVSHEGTTTFGGEWLRSSVKNKWKDWKDNISWDIVINVLQNQCYVGTPQLHHNCEVTDFPLCLIYSISKQVNLGMLSLCVRCLT